MLNRSSATRRCTDAGRWKRQVLAVSGGDAPQGQHDERGVDVQARLSGFSPDGAVLAVGNDQIRQPQ